MPKWPPDDFLVADEPLLREIDSLVYALLEHRKTVAAVDTNLGRLAEVRDVVVRLVHALHETSPGKLFAQESIVIALEGANDAGFARRLGPRWTVELRVTLTAAQLQARLPGVAVPAGILRRAVELWPTRQKAERTAALHALAKALDCDVKEITQAMRTAKNKWRAANRARGKARRAREFPPTR